MKESGKESGSFTRNGNVSFVEEKLCAVCHKPIKATGKTGFSLEDKDLCSECEAFWATSKGFGSQ